MRIERVMRELAEDQHAVVATWQLLERGFTYSELYYVRQRPDWEQLSRRVLARTGVPVTDHQRLMAAVLDASPGAAISSTTAAWMWDRRGFTIEPIHVVRPKGLSRRASALAIVHEVVDLHPSQIKVMHGIPVISPGRLVCELCGTHPHRAERVLDQLWSDGLLDGRTFRRTVEQLKDRGREGSTLFRELDVARGPLYVPPSSGLEKRFMEICLWPMRRQIDSGGEEWCGRVDFRDLELPLIVEVQSEKYHAALVDRAADAERRARLEAAGFSFVAVWDTEVWHRPDVVNDRILNRRRDLARKREIPSPVR